MLQEVVKANSGTSVLLLSPGAFPSTLSGFHSIQGYRKRMQQAYSGFVKGVPFCTEGI